MTEKSWGIIESVEAFWGVILGDDDVKYAFDERGLEHTGPALRQLRYGQRVLFTPIEGPTSGRDRGPRAVEIQVMSGVRRVG